MPGEIILRAILLSALLCACVGKSPPLFDHGVALGTNRQLTIAHRGSSGEYPEHTSAAYQAGIDEGADVIECDLCVTRDLQLVCLHESWMNGTTNVSSVYPGRANNYTITDVGLLPFEDYFTVDFTLEELKAVGIKQRYSFRDPNYNYQFPIMAFEELIQMVQAATRAVGISPELKQPLWVNSLDFIQDANTTFEQLVVDLLDRYGYTESTDPCFIQSFNLEPLRNLSLMTDLPLTMLLPLGASISDERLADLATFAYAIGPGRRALVKVNDKDQVIGRTNLTGRAHSFGLKVHPYTLKNEDQYLAWDYGQDPYNEYQDFLDLEADGIFTDFPGSHHKFINAAYSPCDGSETRHENAP